MIIEEKEIVDVDAKIEELCKEFTRVAEEEKSKYRIVNNGDEASLIQPYFIIGKWFIGTKIVPLNIHYIRSADTFEFYSGIGEEVYAEVKPLLEKLNLKQKFDVEVIKNEM